MQLHTRHVPRSCRPKYAHNRRSSSSSTGQEQESELPTNENSIDNEANSVTSSSRQSSESVDATPKITDLDPEYLKELKRRSLPYKPPRSSNLALPPETPPEDSPPPSPLERTPSPRRASDGALPDRRRSCGEWCRRLLTGGRPSLAHIRNDIAYSGDGNDDVTMDDGDDVVPLDDQMSSGISESLDGATVPKVKARGSRYITAFPILWILRQWPKWLAAVNPLVYGYRFLNNQWRSINMDEENSNKIVSNPTSSSSNDSQSSQHIEDALSSKNPVEWQGIPVIEGIGPKISSHVPGLELVGNPPPAPRPAHRSFPSVSSTLLGAARLTETITRSRTREFAEATLLMNIGIQRRLGSSLKAAPTASLSDPNENGTKESTTSSTGTTDVESVVGEGNLIIPDAIGSSAKESAANLIQDWVMSVETVGKGTSSTNAEEASSSAIGPGDANVGGNAEDFAPLERVRSHASSPWA
jgi:hypothetical protein